jgi:hypothetical protein
MGIGRPCLQQIQRFQLLKQFPLNHSKALFAHQRESVSKRDLAERQFSRDHLFQVPAKRVGTEARDMNGSGDFVLMLEENRHLAEFFSVPFDRPEVFVYPDDDASRLTALSQRFEAAQGVGKCQSGMNVDAPLSTINDSSLARMSLHKSIKSPPVDLVPIHELEMPGAQCGILRKRLVHRVSVNADRANALGLIELRDEARDQAFANTALPL